MGRQDGTRPWLSPSPTTAGTVPASSEGGDAMPNVIVWVCPKCHTMYDTIPWWCLICPGVIPIEEQRDGKPAAEMANKPRPTSAMGPPEDTPGSDATD